MRYRKRRYNRRGRRGSYRRRGRRVRRRRKSIYRLRAGRRM